MDQVIFWRGVFSTCLVFILQVLTVCLHAQDFVFVRAICEDNVHKEAASCLPGGLVMSMMGIIYARKCMHDIIMNQDEAR